MKKNVQKFQIPFSLLAIAKLFLFKLFLFIFFVLEIIPLLAIASPTTEESKAQEQEISIVETVKVENTEVPVRVFGDDGVVNGLTKDDFQLFINGKPTNITGFYTVCNKLDRNSAETAPSTGTIPTGEDEDRLFVLIFNLSDANQDLQSAMDIFFDSVVRPKDRIMVISNHYFVAEWEVKDPAKAKERVAGILIRQFGKLRAEMAWFENELKSIARTVKSRLKDMTEKADSRYPAHIFEEFFVNYRFILEDIKAQYLSLPTSHYIRIANYLKGQRAQKWIFNFYQVARLPLLDREGQINTILEFYATQNQMSTKRKGLPRGWLTKEFHTSPRFAAKKLRDLYYQFTAALEAYDEMMNNDISKAFINTGATFHTMLMKPVRQGFSGDYKFKEVSSDTEIILKKLSRVTGGSIISTNDMNRFIDKFSQKEDVLYVLTYVPDETTIQQKERPTVMVKLNKKNKKYRLIFDDHKREYAFRSIERQLNQQEPDIEIEKVVYKDDRLTVKLKNIKMVQYENEIYGAVRARIKILDNEAKVLKDYSKSFKGIDEAGVFQASLPQLNQGKYNIVLEVKDLFSLKNTVVGEAISIIKH